VDNEFLAFFDADTYDDFLDIIDIVQSKPVIANNNKLLNVQENIEFYVFDYDTSDDFLDVIDIAQSKLVVADKNRLLNIQEWDWDDEQEDELCWILDDDDDAQQVSVIVSTLYKDSFFDDDTDEEWVYDEYLNFVPIQSLNAYEDYFFEDDSDEDWYLDEYLNYQSPVFSEEWLFDEDTDEDIVFDEYQNSSLLVVQSSYEEQFFDDEVDDEWYLDEYQNTSLIALFSYEEWLWDDHFDEEVWWEDNYLTSNAVLNTEIGSPFEWDFFSEIEEDDWSDLIGVELTYIDAPPTVVIATRPYGALKHKKKLSYKDRKRIDEEVFNALFEVAREEVPGSKISNKVINTIASSVFDKSDLYSHTYAISKAQIEQIVFDKKQLIIKRLKDEQRKKDEEILLLF
jgi:hypothetical protein